MTRSRSGTPRRALELLLVAAFLALAAYFGSRVFKRAFAGYVAPVPVVPTLPASEDRAVGAPPAAEPPRPGSVTALPRVRLSRPPKPPRRKPSAVPTPDSR